MPGAASPGLILKAVVVAIAILAIVVPTLLLRVAPPLVRLHAPRAAPARVIPAAELPAVEPVAYQDLYPSEARTFNASVPFVDGPNPPARPFKLAGDDAQRARAIDCMAAAVLYEAGDDPRGQRAVAQVVINRVRHPAFPKTICGVVFQGAERTTGCQFTFTCDGALVRHHWLDVQWARARQVATAALSGDVFAPVGYATHYHTDWVVPYWQSSLDKIAAVDTHLFFRWTGWWGTPAAFHREVSPDEPVIAQLAAYSPAHRMAAGSIEAPGETTDPASIATSGSPAVAMLPLASDPNLYLITLDVHGAPDEFAALALRLCGDRPLCKVMGWSDRAKTPTAWPLQPLQMAAMGFSYLRDLRDRAHPFDRTQWNCAEFPRPDPKQCMRVQAVFPLSHAAETAKAEGAGAASAEPPVADGSPATRHKDEASTVKPAPAVKATPAVLPAPVRAGR
ncbi:cell wall hydrolase [Sphingomonas sp. RB3P16]|uniref:cell wall hydrolase n=1 Tax=Parasphingomonas frigoris TaxID=3096163 RepID=UPI002FCB17CE